MVNHKGPNNEIHRTSALCHSGYLHTPTVGSPVPLIANIRQNFMPTDKQILGSFGEVAVTRNIPCPSCKRIGALKRLPSNFRCADVICDFCGYLAQVKSATANDISVLPDSILGAAWGPQKERMDSGIYFPLFLVLYKSIKEFSIYYLPADLQLPGMFLPRKALSLNARRAGWQGFVYVIKDQKHLFTRLK